MSPKPLLASILMKQQTLTAFEKYGKTTRRAQFLAEMEQVVPWTQLCALIEPIYPKGGSGEGGRPPVPYAGDLCVGKPVHGSPPAVDGINPTRVTTGGRHGPINRSHPTKSFDLVKVDRLRGKAGMLERPIVSSSDLP